VSFNTKVISVNKNNIEISSGMAVSAEIKTGKRKIIEFS
jgi:hypothetical protein